MNLHDLHEQALKLAEGVFKINESQIKCPKCDSKNLVLGVMSPNELFVVTFDGVFCANCNFHEQIGYFYANRVNRGLQNSNEMKNFKQFLLGNNNRLRVSPSDKRALI